MHISIGIDKKVLVRDAISATTFALAFSSSVAASSVNGGFGSRDGSGAGRGSASHCRLCLHLSRRPYEGGDGQARIYRTHLLKDGTGAALGGRTTLLAPTTSADAPASRARARDGLSEHARAAGTDRSREGFGSRAKGAACLNIGTGNMKPSRVGYSRSRIVEVAASVQLTESAALTFTG